MGDVNGGGFRGVFALAIDLFLSIAGKSLFIVDAEEVDVEEVESSG